MGHLDIRSSIYQSLYMYGEPPVEWEELYRPGGLHPIEIGHFIDSESRFEVCHKYGHGTGYGYEFTEWFTRDHVQKKWKLVKIFTADDSSEDHPELVLALILEDYPRQVLQDNYIITPSESFWIDGPNGRHLCLVFPVLDPRPPQALIYRNDPDQLIDLCFQVAKAVAFLHNKGICHGNLQERNVRMIVDTGALEEEIRNLEDLHEYMGEPCLLPLDPIEGDDPRPHGPLHVVEPGQMDSVDFICEPKKIGVLGFEHWYDPEELLDTPKGRHLSLFPPILHPGKEVRDGHGLTGFPSDIWSLACLFGEFRTENEFTRAPKNYGTPLTIEEIKVYLRAGSYRIEPSYYDQRREPIDSDEYSESDNKSDINTSDDKAVTTRDRTQPTTPRASQHELKSNEAKIVEVPVDRCITRSMSRMQQSIFSTNHLAQMGKHNTFQSSPKSTTKSIESSQSPAKDQIGERATNTQHKGQKNSSPIRQADEENDKIKSLGTDAIERSNGDSQDSGMIHDPCSTKPEEQLIDKSIVTPPSTEQTTENKEPRSDRINDEHPTLPYYEMSEDEVSIFADLLGKMLAPNPEDRLTIDEVLNHEWFGDRRATLAPKEE